ncbi:MAG: HlyD family efflux transporter periplasmic adaptor subunit [Cyanobium sp.]
MSLPSKPTSASPTPLSLRETSSVPPTLMLATADDYLPGPGPWASLLGRQLLVAMLVGSAALGFWPMRETVRASGMVRPSGENSVVQSEQGGSLQQVMLKPNQQVRVGAVLAVFDSRPLQLERQQLKQEVQALERQLGMARGEQQSLATQAEALRGVNRSLTSASRQGVAQAQSALTYERRELDRYRSLAAAGAVPRSLAEERQVRQVVSESELLKAVQGVAEQQARGVSELARLRQAEFQARSSADELHKQLLQRVMRLQQLERAIDQSRVLAPISGSVVSTALRHPGQVLRAGEPLAVIAPAAAPLEIRVQVPSESISPLRPGQQASVRIGACPTAEFGVLPARVQSVAADVAPQQENKASGYDVVLTSKRRDLQGRGTSCALRPGMAVTADVVTRQTTVLMFLLNKLRILG